MMKTKTTPHGGKSHRPVGKATATFTGSIEADPEQQFQDVQGLSILFACVGSGDPVRVLRLYTTNTLDDLLKHLLLRHMYNLPLPILLCYAQALRSETSYCYCDRVTLSASVRVCVLHCTVWCFIYCLCRH